MFVFNFITKIILLDVVKKRHFSLSAHVPKPTLMKRHLLRSAHAPHLSQAAILRQSIYICLVHHRRCTAGLFINKEHVFHSTAILCRPICGFVCIQFCPVSWQKSSCELCSILAKIVFFLFFHYKTTDTNNVNKEKNTEIKWHQYFHLASLKNSYLFYCYSNKSIQNPCNKFNLILLIRLWACVWL